MPKLLKFQVRSPTGIATEFAFPLHPETVSVEVVTALVKAALAGVDREARNHPKVSSSDVLQALAIALSARAALIDAPIEKATSLAKGLLNGALAAAGKTRKQTRVGNA